MSDQLITLFSDFRLFHLFGNDQNLTVTQIWILEIERESVSEFRFLYARVLPSTYQSDKWNSTASTKTLLYEKCFAKIHALTLHTSTQQLKIFLENFIEGASFGDASQKANLELPVKLSAKKVTSVTFGANPIIRPVMHLPTRNYYQFQTNRLSPTNCASVDSGAASTSNKPEVFCMPEGCDRQIAEAACQALDADTGLNFSAIDAWRIGDFEFICAPGLNAKECRKFDIIIKREYSSLMLYEPLTQESTDLLVIVTIYSDDSVQASYVTRLEKHVDYPLEHLFVLKEFKNQGSTSFTLEIYSIDTSGESFLQLKTGEYLIRNINFGLGIVESIKYTSMGWLEKRIAPKDKMKLATAGRISREIQQTNSTIGTHNKDPWVTLNRLIEGTVKQLYPESSTGKFFLTLTNSNGTSRLELIDWLRKIFERHQNAQIVWIDPFMEDVGIELLNRLGTLSGNYIIITTKKESEENDQSHRIKCLLSKCAQWDNNHFGSVHLRVLTVSAQKIHDRMILIRSANGQPAAGYHLSNSIQRATENYPLLITPIPLDIVPSVFDYTDQIIQSSLYGDEKNVSSGKLIYDSSTAATSKENKLEDLDDSHCFVNASRAGDVLAWWLNTPELAGLSGTELMTCMEAKGSIKDGNLNQDLFDSIPSKFWIEGFPLKDFHSAWDALSYILAYSHSGDLYTEETTSLPSTLKIELLKHLLPTRVDALQPRTKKRQLDIEHYRAQSLAKLLSLPTEPENIFGDFSTDTSWSDYYAIKLLWSQFPDELIDWLSNVCFQPIKHVRTHALVIEAFKVIELEFDFDKQPKQLDALLQSNIDLVIWVGLHFFKNAINNGVLGIESLSKIDHLREQRTILCWLINEANHNKSDIKPHLIIKLIQSIQVPMKNNEIKDIINFCRCRLGRLHYFTPWILESLLVPMLERKLIDIAQLAENWLAELITQWKNSLKDNHPYFRLEADGAFTDELAILINYLLPDDQEKVFKGLRKVLDLLARTIYQPMLLQSNFKSYLRAHEVNLWLFALSRRISTLVGELPLSELIKESEAIIDRLSLNYIKNNELLAYFKADPDQIRNHDLHHIIQVAIKAC